MEIVIATIILALAVIPIFGLLTGGRERAHMSESQIYAELISAHITEDYSTRHFGFGHRSTPVDHNWVETLKGIARDEGWFSKLPEYEANPWSGPAPIEVKAEVKKLGANPGSGLLSFEVSTTWGDRTAGVKIKDSEYHLVRLRAKRDYGLRSIDGARLDANN